MHIEKVLIDTNLLIYSIDEDSQYHRSSLEFFNEHKGKLYTTSKNISEFLAVTTQKNVYSLSIEEALYAVNEFINNMEILFPNKDSFAIFQDLIKRYNPSGHLIHDFEIISITLANSIKDLATLNVKDYSQISEIVVHKI